MSQRGIEIILTRQWASYLAVPIFLVDPDGTLIYYNEPSESLLGQRFEETGEMPAHEWATIFHPTDETGNPLPPEQLPLLVALSERRPAQRRMRIQGLDHVSRTIEVFAIPIIGQANRFVGAMAMFWEVPG